MAIIMWGYNDSGLKNDDNDGICEYNDFDDSDDLRV